MLIHTIYLSVYCIIFLVSFVVLLYILRILTIKRYLSIMQESLDIETERKYIGFIN